MKEARCMEVHTVISALERLRPKFQESLGCSVRPCLRKGWEAGGSFLQSCPQLHSKFKTSFGCMKPCFIKKENIKIQMLLIWWERADGKVSEGWGELSEGELLPST